MRDPLNPVLKALQRLRRLWSRTQKHGRHLEVLDTPFAAGGGSRPKAPESSRLQRPRRGFAMKTNTIKSISCALTCPLSKKASFTPMDITFNKGSTSKL
eukprot:5379129-Amphidinium_carterae.1